MAAFERFILAYLQVHQKKIAKKFCTATSQATLSDAEAVALAEQLEGALNAHLKTAKSGKAVSSSDSDDSSSSDSSSSEDDKPSEKPVANGKVKPNGFAKAAAASNPDSSSSSLDSAPSTSAMSKRKVKASAVKAKQAAAPSAQGPSSTLIESNSSEEELSEPATLSKKPSTKRKSRSSSSEDSSSDDEETDTKEVVKSIIAVTEKVKKSAPQPAAKKAKIQVNGTASASVIVATKQATNGVHKNGKAQNVPFRRVKAEDIQVDERLKDNSYTAIGAGLNDYGAKAHRDLIVTRGDAFRKEKTKKKRGSYRGGDITMKSNSIKFD